jgi:hypothetical protein
VAPAQEQTTFGDGGLQVAANGPPVASVGRFRSIVTVGFKFNEVARVTIAPPPGRARLPVLAPGPGSVGFTGQ